MNKPEPTHQEPTEKNAEPQEKKTYQKPSFRFERVFETTALSCGKVQATQQGCFRSRKS